jgi:hypothetical protein
MSVNISGFGILARLVATKTFPAGISISEWADDADPFDSPSLKIADSAIGLNGHLLIWQKPALIPVTLNIIPDTPTDKNLSILAEANRMSASKGSRPMDLITITVSYPTGRIVTLTSGIMMEATVVPSASSAGRMKTRTYGFAFEDRAETVPN